MRFPAVLSKPTNLKEKRSAVLFRSVFNHDILGQYGDFGTFLGKLGDKRLPSLLNTMYLGMYLLWSSVIVVIIILHL